MPDPDNSSFAAPASASAVLVAGESMTIYTVEALAADWRRAFSAGAVAEIDLGGVKTCDSLGIQLLWAAQRISRQGAAPLRFTRVAGAVRSAAKAIACEGLFAATTSP